jgi:hypothetical protein
MRQLREWLALLFGTLLGWILRAAFDRWRSRELEEAAAAEEEEEEHEEEHKEDEQPRVPSTFDEPHLAAELGIRLRGTPADGSALAPPGTPPPASVIWVDGGDEVVVHLNSTRVRILDRTLLVSVDLETDQTGRTPLIIALALGDAADPAGLIAVTDAHPRGNGLLAARWGRPLQNAVWASMLGLASDHAAERNQAPRGMSVTAGQLQLHAGQPLQVPVARR